MHDLQLLERFVAGHIGQAGQHIVVRDQRAESRHPPERGGELGELVVRAVHDAASEEP